MRRPAVIRRCGSAVLLAGTAVAGIAAQQPVVAKALPVYTIGFEGALSGPSAQLGINEANGAKLAVSKANASGAYPFHVKLVEADDGGDPKQGPAAASLLINSAARAVVGPSFSGVTLAVGAQYESAHLGFVSPSAANPVLSRQGWSTFHRVVPDDNLEGVFAVDWLHRLARPRLYLVRDGSTYGNSLAGAVAREANNKGIHVTEVLQDALTTTSYRPLAQRIVNSGIHTVFYAGFDAQAALLARALVHYGYHGLRVSGNGVFSTVFTTNSGTAGYGWYITCGCMNAYPTVAQKAFAQSYRATYGTAPGTYSAEAYDATNAIIRALAHAVGSGSTTRGTVNAKLRGLNFAGISTRVAFGATGNLLTSVARVYLFEDRSGKLTQLGDIRSQG